MSIKAATSPQQTNAFLQPATHSSPDQTSSAASSGEEAPPLNDGIRSPSVDINSAWVDSLFGDGDVCNAFGPTDVDASAMADVVLASPAVQQPLRQELPPSPPGSSRSSVETGDRASVAEQSQAALGIDGEAPGGGRDSGVERGGMKRGGDDSNIDKSVAPLPLVPGSARLARWDDDVDTTDSEEPVRPWKRRWRRRPSSASRSASVTQDLVPPAKRSRSRSQCSAVEMAGPKRRRPGWKLGGPPGSDIDTSRAGSARSTSPAPATERWAVPCFLRRKTVGSQEMITIELPTCALGFNLLEEGASPTINNVTRCSCSLAAASDKGRGGKFSLEEENELIRLKEQSLPKLSWKRIQKEMHKRFPNRTLGSLQVHYCTRLKGRRSARHRGRGS